MKLPVSRVWFFVILCIAIVYCAVEAGGTGDLLIFLSAAGDLDGSTDIYNQIYFDGYRYYYSVLFAMLLKPFIFLPYYGLKFTWIFLNLLLYCHLFYLLTRISFVQLLSEKRKRIFLSVVFLFSFRFLHENIHTSQITILILWCAVFGLKLVVANRNAGGALLIAAGISIKLLPIVVVPYLIYRGYFRATLFVILIYLLILILPSFFIGHHYNLQLIASWWHNVDPTRSNHVLDVDERSFHGLSTLLSTLLVEKVPDLYAMPLKRNILNVSEHSLFIVLMISRALIAAITLYFLKWPPFKKAKNEWQLATEISYLMLAVPLIFPHQQHYAFLFSVPAFACVCFFLVNNYYTLSGPSRITLMIALILIYLTANLRTILGEFNHYYEHYKILTYGALLLIPALMWVAGKRKFKSPSPA